MASRNSGCPNCGGGGRGSTGHGNGTGGKKGGKFWWWVIGIAAALIYFSNQGTGADSGSKDYVPPGQHQTTQKKCDPGALLQLGCTP